MKKEQAGVWLDTKQKVIELFLTFSAPQPQQKEEERLEEEKTLLLSDIYKVSS